MYYPEYTLEDYAISYGNDLLKDLHRYYEDVIPNKKMREVFFTALAHAYISTNYDEKSILYRELKECDFTEAHAWAILEDYDELIECFRKMWNDGRFFNGYDCDN